MADKRISDLPAAGPLGDTDVVPLVQGGATRKAPLSALDARNDARYPRRGSAGYTAQSWRLNTIGVSAPDAASWVDIEPGLDVTINAQTGDRVEFAVTGIWQNNPPLIYLNAYTLVSGARVNRLETRSGLPGGTGIASVWMPVCVSYMYTVAAADLSAGTVTFRIVAQMPTAGAYPATKNFAGPMGVSARNWG